MADKTKPEMAPQRRTLKLSPALGDWTSYKPSRSLVKKIKVGLYGFDRLSDEELEEVHLLHYRFGETLLKNLKVNFRFSGELFSIEALQSSYGNFQRSVIGPLLQGKIEVPEFHEEIIFCLEIGLISTIINSSLGLKDTKAPGGELTDAEKLIVESTFSQLLASSMDSSFNHALEAPQFEIVGSPDFTPNPYTSVSSAFVYFIIEVSLGDSQGKIIVGYSGNLIKGLLKKIKANEKPRPLSLNKVKAEIFNKTRIPVTVMLGTTELKGNEIYSLEVGDVVSLDNSIHNAIQIRLAEGGTTVLAQPGIKDGKLIARVVGIEKDREIKVAAPLPPPPEPEVFEEPQVEEEIEEEVKEEEQPQEEIFNEEEFKEEPVEEEIEEEEFTEEESPEEELNITEKDLEDEDFGLGENQEGTENKEEI